MVKVRKLKDSKKIKKLISKGLVFKTNKYKFYFLVEGDEFSFAISVSKKIGNAVIRNKEKRWVRNIIYQNSRLINKGAAVFIVIKESGGLFFNASNEIVSFIEKNI